MSRKKEFDCVEMKRQAQEKVHKSTKEFQRARPSCYRERPH